MKSLGISIVILILSACASVPKSRPASEYLLTTDKSTSNVLNDLKVKLEEKKYKIQKLDVTAGILTVEPRSYIFISSGKKIFARQIVQIRQEGGSVKVRFIYECNYSEIEFETCHAEDEDSNAKISKIEPKLIREIRPLLMKHGSANE